MDDDGYPDDEELERIRTWPAEDCWGCLEYVKDLWHWPDYAMVLYEFDGEDGIFYRFATGGWSGNESLIAALEDNARVRILCWTMSQRGGLFIYEVPDYQVKAAKAKVNA